MARFWRSTASGKAATQECIAASGALKRRVLGDHSLA